MSTRKIVHAGLLALLIVSSASVVSLSAQVQPAPQQPVRSEQKQATGASADRGQGPGRQLVHQSNEAAGEDKDENSRRWDITIRSAPWAVAQGFVGGGSGSGGSPSQIGARFVSP